MFRYKKEVFMSKKVKNRNYSISSIALLLIVGSIFMAVGIAILGITLNGLIEYGITLIGIGIIMPIVLIIALLGFGIMAIVMGSKQIYFWVMQSKTLKYGRDATAKIVDYSSASFTKNTNNKLRYSFTLSYNDSGTNKNFKTDYIYDINEFKHLKELDRIKIKIHGNFVAICETFTEDIYKLDSTYGIEIAFFKQKPVSILFKLWMVFFLIALILLFVSLGIGNGTFMSVSLIFLFTIHFPFAITLAIYLIKWLKRKN